MKIFSERLKKERISNGYSQNDFAKVLGLSRSTYSHYEILNEINGREPPYEILCKIAKALDVSSDYLLGLED